MRPSELRREERRAWLHFVALCLGSVGIIVVADLVAGILVSDRYIPPADEVEALEHAPEYPQHVVAALGSDIIHTSERLHEVLRAERRTEIAGSVLFLKGMLTIAHRVGDTPDGRRLITALLTPRGSSGAGTDGAGRLGIEVFADRGGTWQSLGPPLFTHDYTPAAAAALSAGGVVIQDVGDAVFAVTLPDEHRCLPTSNSDRALRRTLYVALDSAPAVLLSHVSHGVRGNDALATAQVGLRWEQRDGPTGRGQLFVTETRGARTDTWQTPFHHHDRVFGLTNNPSTLFEAEERIAVASAREGREGAQTLLENQLHVLQLVAPVEGPLPYCVGFPHRIARDPSVDAQRWQDALADRLFQVRLPLAELLAQHGRLRQAIATLGLREPALVLTSSVQGRRVLDYLLSARVVGLGVFPVELRTRSLFVDHPRFKPTYPLLWTAAGELLVPEPGEFVLPTGLLAAIMAGGAAGGSSAATTALVRDPFATQAPNLWQGAVHGVASLLVAEDPPTLAARVAESVQHSAGERVAALAKRDRRYTGDRFRKLDVLTSGWSTASWDDMQAYQPFLAPLDLSPSESRLLVDFGQTCEGGFLELCMGVPERCRDLAAPATSGVPAGKGPSMISPVVWPDIVREPCYPGELPRQERDDVEFLGWSTDSLAVFERLGSVIAVDIDISGAASASPLDPEAQAPPSMAWRSSGDGNTVVLDGYGIWLVNSRTGREVLLEWWERIPIGPPAGDWRATLSPDGRLLAVWLEGEGLWTATVARLEPR